MGNEGYENVIRTEGGRTPAEGSVADLSASENRSYGSGMRGIELFSSSPLVGLQEEFSSLVEDEGIALRSFVGQPPKA